MIHECLDRDQHRLLIRQTFHIHWETTVKEYVDRFAALIDQLKFYNPATDPLDIWLLILLMGCEMMSALS